MKHCPVFLNIGHAKKPMTVHICELSENRLGKRVSAVVLLDYAGDIVRALEAYDSDCPKEGENILHNLP